MPFATGSGLVRRKRLEYFKVHQGATQGCLLKHMASWQANLAAFPPPFRRCNLGPVLMHVPALGSSLCRRMEPGQCVVPRDQGRLAQPLLVCAVRGSLHPIMVLGKKLSCLWALGLCLVASKPSPKVPTNTDQIFIDHCIEAHNEMRGKVSPPAANMKHMVRKNWGWELL